MMLLIGAGSHAQRLVSLFDIRDQIAAYVSPEKASWLNEPGLGDGPLKRFADDGDALSSDPGLFVMGIGGVRPEQLAKRRSLIDRYVSKGWRPASLHAECSNIHRKAVVQRGVHVLNGAIVSPHAVLRENCLVNCGAIVEHHAMIGRGVHVAPGAVILGNVVVGDDCMIGANATVIEGAKVPDGTLVKAGTVWKWRGICTSCGALLPLSTPTGATCCLRCTMFPGNAEAHAKHLNDEEFYMGNEHYARTDCRP